MESPIVLALFRSENSVVPQLRQKPRLIPLSDSNEPTGPSTVKLSSGTITRA